MNETSALLRTRCQGREAPCIDQGFQHLCLHASYTPVVTCACMDTCTRAKEGGTATVYVVLSTEIFVVFFLQAFMCRLHVAGISFTCCEVVKSHASRKGQSVFQVASLCCIFLCDEKLWILLMRAH
ncbi:putative transmembrane protein [Toxoplasma gondii VEG]|uniref:Transmembrane protein n=1 Tax=Toxoplasma gondii (strain ATCC 50861 / VEG) TaxID=432359 RepID=V4Z958_TOXGV|nr:putative transmembrane protein [Toxoplasma gondii VEG]